MIRALPLSLTALACAAPGHAQVAYSSVSLQASPERAAQINPILAQHGEPVIARVPAGRSLNEALANRCGGIMPVLVGAAQATSDGSIEQRHYPCVRSRPARTIMVSARTTLEALARQFDVPANMLSRASGGGRPPAILEPGARIVLPSRPTWTNFRLRVDRGGPLALMRALAVTLSCPANSPQECLVRRGVVLFTETRGSNGRAPASINPFDIVLTSGVNSHVFAHVIASAITVRGPERFEVSKTQWPYDVARVRRALGGAATVLPGVVGIADTGLAGRDGAPLPADIFHRGPDSVDENVADDDDNLYLDDLIGAGPRREGEDLSEDLLGSGDLRLCANPEPDFPLWGEKPRFVASHGAMVASIAAGLEFAESMGQRPAVLPKIKFYRLLNLCSPASEVQAKPADVTAGVAYLFGRDASIVSLSQATSASETRMEAPYVKTLLERRDRLLVLAAGNYGRLLPSDDLSCFACLANDQAVNRQVYVVGAAGRNLSRLITSNHGRPVSFYAPGEWREARPIAGAPLPSTVAEPSTSAAAPLVALALHILRAHGITDPVKLRQRLIETSWPLEEPETSNGEGLWVVDLTKAAAVKRDSVEALMPDDDGVKRRRTYVGEIENRTDVRLCQGGSLDPIKLAQTRAVRLWPAVDGGRRVLRFKSATRHDGLAFAREDTTCNASIGVVRIKDDLSGETESIPAGDVMAVVFALP